MGSVVYLSPLVRVGQYLGLTSQNVRLTSDNYAVELPLEGDYVGEAAGEDAGKIPANKPVVLRPVSFNVKKYMAMVSINPALLAAGTATCQTILTAGEGPGFAVYFTPRKAFDLGSLDYLVRIALID